ncbi:acyl-CoA dehydrogenase family protein [Gordonia alkanivorans]|uniref:acyl-CoA dehydrogenase family protein n=1 Tax=Gordonia alkanivorans TaxID=84096 RepID=UPI00244CD75C|nr:acyl-CoA dehydrogenase family protein [Gordonia alkanivorans]MDH3047234.1 acyl-CoA dehydrogenase family protein [Gordonia alkanivorans]
MTTATNPSATNPSATVTPDSLARFADETRTFLADHAEPRSSDALSWGEGDDRTGYFSDDPPEVERANVDAARAWQRTRYENGFGWITGPAAYGGRELTPVHELVYNQIETGYAVADTGVLSLIGLGMIGPTILAHGRDDIKDRYLPAMYRGDAIACQLFSEPGAGSDLAGVRTRAERTDDGWVLRGQKVWTSVAQHAQLGMALCRTDPDAPKHKGITAFLVDLSLPGVEVRPLRQMIGGAEFNEVFLTDVRVPDDHRLGEVNGGWRVALTTLMNERASVGGESTSTGVARVLSEGFLPSLLHATGHESDGAARRRLAEITADLTAAEYLNRQTLRTLRSGAEPGPEASVSKLLWAQNLTRVAHFAAELVGPKLTADTGEWGTFSWTELLLSTPAFRILGGTEEIMKNILGERVLGLPKEPS